MLWRGLAAGIVALVLVPAAARADGLTAALDPNTTGAGSHLELDAQGAAGGLRPGVLPAGVTLLLQKGFTITPDAVAGVCSDDQAKDDKCPPNAIIGTGSFDLHATGFIFGPGGQDFTAALTFYRATPRQPGDPMGVVFAFRETSSGFHGASIGRLQTLSDPVFGYAIAFDRLPVPPLPNGLSFSLKRMRVDIGAGTATPPVRVKPKKKRKHRCRRVTKRVHGKKKTVFVCPKKHKPKKKRAATRAAIRQAGGLAFLANPATCSGTWRVEVDIAYPDGTEKHAADAPCAGG